MSGRKKILTVDDDEEILELLKTGLETAGYDVLQTDTGIEALELVRAEHPDLIILDYILPDMDGPKIARLLRSEEGSSRIPIIMLTALGDKKHRLIGYESDVDDYETKPYEMKYLLEKISKLLNGGVS